MSDWREDAKARVADKSQGDRFKLVEGPNIFRILPDRRAIKKDDYEKYPPYKEYLVHKNVGPNKKIVVCGKDIVTREGECWLCDEVIERYNKSGKASKRAVAKQIDPVPQMIMQVAKWDKGSESLRGPLKFYVPGSGGANSISVKLEGLLANSRRHYDHPRKGYNINIPRTGTGPKDTRYGAPEPDESSSKVSSSILRKVKSFDELVDEYDEEFQRATFYGEQADASNRRDFKNEEDKHMALKKKDADVKKKGKKKEEVEETSSESESESSSESESEAPKGKAKKKGPGRPKGSGKKKEEEEEGSSSESESSSSESESGSGSESSSESSSESESESEPKKAKKKKKK